MQQAFFYTRLRASGWSQVDLLKMVGFFLHYKTGNEILCISVLLAVIIFLFPWLVFISPCHTAEAMSVLSTLRQFSDSIGFLPSSSGLLSPTSLGSSSAQMSEEN